MRYWNRCSMSVSVVCVREFLLCVWKKTNFRCACGSISVVPMQAVPYFVWEVTMNCVPYGSLYHFLLGLLSVFFLPLSFLFFHLLFEDEGHGSSGSRVSKLLGRKMECLSLRWERVDMTSAGVHMTSAHNNGVPRWGLEHASKVQDALKALWKVR